RPTATSYPPRTAALGNRGQAGHRPAALAKAPETTERDLRRRTCALRFNIYPDRIAGLPIDFDIQFGGAVIDDTRDFDLHQIQANIVGSQRRARYLHRSAIEQRANWRDHAMRRVPGGRQ